MLQIESMSMIAGGFLIRYFRGRALNFKLPLVAGAALAVGNLAGNPQPIVYFHYAIAVGVAILACELWRRTGEIQAGVRMAAGGIVAFVLGILLAAVHLVPTAFLIAISPRAEILREAAVWTPINLQQLSMLLFPGFYQMLPWHLQWPPYAVDINLSFTNLVEGYIPIGVFAAALGLLGWFHYRKSLLVQALGWGCVFLLACAVGDELPFYGWLYQYLPGISLLRVSARILLVFFPAWGIMVALGVQALWRNEPRVLHGSRFVALLLLITTVSMAAYAFAGHYGNWMGAWLENMAQFVQDYVLHNLYYFESKRAAIVAALITQIILGLFFLTAMLLLFTLPGRHFRARTLTIIAFMCVEIFLYSFGWNMAITYPPLDTGIVEEYYSFPGVVKGRTVGLHGEYAGPINAALYMDVPPLANGYSVTFDRWIDAFRPEGHPPWSVGLQKVLCDLWNVTDLAFPRRPTQAQVAGQPMIVGDWGWTALTNPPDPESGVTIDVGRAAMPTTFTMAFLTDQPVKALHVLGLAGESAPLPDGTEIGTITLNTTQSDGEVSAPILLGKHVSDPFYPGVGPADVVHPGHSLAPVAYRRNVTGHWTDGAIINDARIDVATSAPLVSVDFEVITPHPATLGITHVIAILEDGTTVTREAFETAGFQQTESQNPNLYTVRRDAPGYIRMMPNAVGGSYKKTDYVLWRLFKNGIDLSKTVIVDKRQFNEEVLEKLNAPNPDTFRGTATITWKNDEHAVIQAEANQSGWVFLSYAWDAGWSAKVNGESAVIHRASGPFMAFPVKAGKTEIVMSYRPQGLLLGGAISFVALLALIGAWVFIGKRQRER